LTLYSSQQFFIPLINSVFFGGVTAAILSKNMSEIYNSIILMVIMFCAVLALVGVGAYLYIVTSSYAERDMSIDLFKAFLKSSVENLEHSGEGIAKLNTDVSVATNIISDAFAPFMSNVLAAFLSTIAVLTIDLRMGFGVFSIGTLIFLAQTKFAKPLATLGKAQLETNTNSIKALSNILSGALTIRAYNRQDRSLIQFDNENGKLMKISFKRAFIGMWQDLITTIQGWLTIIVTFSLGGWLVITSDVDFSLIMMVLPFAAAVCSAMSQVGMTYAGLYPPLVAAKRVFQVIDSVKFDIKDVSSSDETVWNGRYDIDINDLCFSYKDAVTNALSNITINLGENKMIAFIGKSGSGKSTLLRVLTGMYERNGLNMKIGDLSFSPSNIKEWRSHFAYVDQSCKLFDVSISENIALGAQGEVNKDHVKEASKRAFAHDFISELNEGYETACGEKGSNFSGGQKQRIAIARALCRRAPVLVFDEATSALDPESERSIMETIKELRRDHTILITTHNLGTIATADKIVVLDNGRIAEQGTHEQLINKNGLYKKLFKESQVAKTSTLHVKP